MRVASKACDEVYNGEWFRLYGFRNNVVGDTARNPDRPREPLNRI
jgi:hypothetical protein